MDSNYQQKISTLCANLELGKGREQLCHKLVTMVNNRFSRYTWTGLDIFVIEQL